MDGAAVLTAQPSIQVVAAPSFKYVTSGLSGTVQSGIPQSVTVSTLDLNNNPTSSYAGTSVATSNDAGATLPANYSFGPSDAGVHVYSVTFLSLGAKEVRFEDSVNATIAGTLSVTVVAQDPDRVVWSGAATAVAESCSSQMTLTSMDPVGNVSAVLSSKEITFSGLGSALLYSNSTCTSPITTVTINTGASSTNLWMKDMVPESLVLSASAEGFSSGTNAFTVNPAPSWIGNGSVASTLTDSGSVLKGKLSAQLMQPAAAIESDGSYYVSDIINHRVLKYNAATGTLVGWLGGIGTNGTPTGGEPGCSVAATATPGWCLGGMSKTGTGNNQFNTPRGLAVIGNWLYIVDSLNSRIVRIDTVAGTFGGWTGNVSTAPTGGTAGCSGHAVSTGAAGWCTGGKAKAGTIDGTMSSPRGLATDGIYLYLADYENWRISKWDASTGVFVGWIGWVGTVATGGAAGCSTAAVSALTPGWCTGGKAKTGGTAPGQFKKPTAVMVSGGLLYTAGTENSVQRFSLGTENLVTNTGWYGRGNGTTFPTSGAAGCTTLASGITTPGWCVGGPINNTASTTLGQMTSPSGLSTDGTYIYISDQLNNRISRINLSTGAYGGSIGRVSSVGSSGDPGCTSASLPFTYTPGWCMGATPMAGSAMSASNNIASTWNIGATMVAADQLNGRLQIIDSTTGQVTGWIGDKTSPVTAWTKQNYSVGMFSNHTDGLGFVSAASTSTSNVMSGLAADNGTLYVVDSANSRIKSINSSTGATNGWIGGVGATLTGGGASCTSLAISSSSATPIWCTGGLPVLGTGVGRFNLPQSVYVSGNYAYVSDTANSRIVRILTATGAASGWIGNVKTVGTGGGCGVANASTTGWCTGGTSQLSALTGSYSAPAGITGDGTHLYVVDSGNSRIQKISMATGVSSGWIGKVATVPTGGTAGCTSLLVTQIAKVWCTGGTATGSGSTAALMDGAFKTPRGISYDNGYLYVADQGNHRITRHTAATGAYNGWSGGISATKPTGGDTGCINATPLTPGWCTGGVSASNTGGGFNAPRDIAVSGSFYYVVDSANNRISKFSTAGVYIGWKGLILTSPTSGASGCAGAAVGSVTPGWCVGGTSQRSILNGSFDSPVGITADSSWIYVTDGDNGRISRIAK